MADTDGLACPYIDSVGNQLARSREMFVDNGLLYHRDTILGHKVKQQCLMEHRVPVALEMSYDALLAGNMIFKLPGIA